MLRLFTRFGLLEAFVAIVTLLFLVLTLLDYLQTKHAAQAQAEAVLSQSERTVTVEVQRLSAAARTLIAQLEEGGRKGTLDFARPAALNALLMPALREYAPLSSVNHGDAAGNGYLLLRDEAGWKNRLKKGASPSAVNWISYDSMGNETARWQAADDYDPRRRPWFRQAPASGALLWGSPYILRTTGDLGITASKAMGGGREVLGVDVKLKDLSFFLAANGNWSKTTVVIADAAGNVLASSDVAGFGTLLARSGTSLPSLAETGFRIEREAVQAWEKGEGKAFHRLDTSSGVIFARVGEIALDPGNRARVILTVPRSAFMESFSSGLVWKIVAYLALLLGASLVYLRRYIFPIRHLVRLIGEFDFSQPRLFPDSRRRDEIGLLHSHLNQLTCKLVEGMKALESDISSRRKAEEEARNARDYLNSVLNTIADPVFVKDEKHRLVLVNDAECALAGSSRDALLGKTDYDFFPAEQVDLFWKIDDLVLETGESNVNEEVITDAGSGKLRNIVTRKTRYVNPDGRRFIVGVIRDITELREAQIKVVESARRSGMAEIANNMLHNIGNVLNSVNVSAGKLMKLIAASKAPGLARAAGLIKEHALELDDFLSRDQKGKLLPGYLDGLAQALAAEQERMREEVERLTKNVDHIKQIVATQQSYAGASNLIESVQVRNLLEDALQMNAESLRRHSVAVVREFGEVAQMPLDKGRLLLILVNLISNAGHAMAGASDRQHVITLGMCLGDGAHGRSLQVRVEDNGVGIPADNLTRIFAHGFTTRKSGHGFGLHSCAMAAKEMGGTLTAHSEGLGSGATFTLEIPIKGIPAAE